MLLCIVYDSQNCTEHFDVHCAPHCVHLGLYLSGIKSNKLLVFQEICNAYTELNDPFVQRAQFEKQVIKPINSSFSRYVTDKT